MQSCPYPRDSKSGDLEAPGKNTQFLVDFTKDKNKDVVVMTNGSTTDFYANSIEEQKTTIGTVVETVDGVIPAIRSILSVTFRSVMKGNGATEKICSRCG